MKKKETKSEFGMGLAYCIGLFLCHVERYQGERKQVKSILPERTYVEMWFNSASDHLYELDTSTVKDKKLKKEIENWRAKCLHWGHGFSKPYANEVDRLWSIDKAKEFLRRLDELNGVKTIKGTWE
jgi:hypothetical protein